jgi:hypothetical protein
MKRLATILLSWLLLSSCNESNGTQDRLEAFEQDGLYGFRKDGGAVVIEPRFYAAQEFNDYGIAAVLDDSGWSYINRKREVVIRPFIFDNGPDYFKEGVARFVRTGKFGFFDESGRIVIEPLFDFVVPFSDSLAVVCNGCAIQTAGEHRKYEGGKWGYINHKGEIVIELQYDKANSFENGKAQVVQGEQSFYIDKNGDVVE